MISAFLFQRSLRLDDNLGLLKALRESVSVLPVFCVDPRQATPSQNPYFSAYSLGFMYQSLQDLQKQLKSKGSDLVLITGEVHKILPQLLRKRNVQTLYMNRDYTPFARKRAEQLTDNLGEIKLVEVDDYLLFDPNVICTKSGTAFRMFTPFMNKVLRKKVDKPIKISQTNKFMSASSLRSHPSDASLGSEASILSVRSKKGWKLLEKFSKYAPLYDPGGREEGLRRLHDLPRTQKYYDRCRDYLTYRTSNLSAYIKFGCISIREARFGFGKISGRSGQELKRQLLWREYYYHYYISYPEELEWNKKVSETKLNNKAPRIVRDCYVKLDRSGYLSNRGRLILGNYLLKYQKSYWKQCDRMFARRLVDYDPIVNIGNWRWIEKQPKFKTLKPKVQEKKYDRECPHYHK